MESIISALIGGGAAVLACIINNNTLRAKTQATIENQVKEINFSNEKSTAIITERLAMLTEQVQKGNQEQHDLIRRMYEVESEISRQDDRINRLEQKA